MKTWRGAVVALVLILLANMFCAAQASAARPQGRMPTCAGEAGDEETAVAVAASCHRSVVVGASRTEVSQVTAQPDGRLVLESTVEPQRTRLPGGSWADVDLKLHRSADGSVRPAASVADVRFSGGGRGVMATLVRGGSTFSLSWPGLLPVPRVAGDSATYPEVIPGVDLVLRATRTGFSHVLVIRTPQAAQNPALYRIRLGVGGDTRLVQSADGSLRATAPDGAVLASAPPAAMWDSTATVASTPGGAAATDVVTAGATGPDASSPAGPGDTAVIGAVGTEVASDGSLTLVPERALLSRSNSFPVYVDPAWSVGKARWAYSTNTGANNTDYSVARVGKDPASGVLYRSFFEFPTTANNVSLSGKHITSAYVQMNLDHSWSCGDTWAHMFLTPAINATMHASWSRMTLTKWLSAAEGHANETGSGCGAVQPDMIMNFTGDPVTSQVQTAATDNWTSMTVGFCACNAAGQYETSTDRWKKFFPNDAKLIVDYDSVPAQPTGLQVAGIACSTAPITVGTTTPSLSAVYPDADAGQVLSGAFEWIEMPADGVVTDTVPARKPAPPQAPASANGRATSAPLGGLVTGTTYAYRVRTTDPAPYGLTGPWSSWCQFAVDTGAPAVSVTVVSAPAGPGLPGTFRIESPDTDVTTFRYGFTSATTPVAAQGTGPRYAQVTVTVPRYGQNTLYVAAVDSTGNVGSGSRDFTVASPAPAVARWALETHPGVTTAQALADQQAAAGGDTPLTASGVTWADGVRLVGGQTASFNGSTASASAAAPVVDTSGSFSVAAWVKVDSLTGCTTLDVASIDDPSSTSAAFTLGLDCATGRWRWQVADRQTGTVTYTVATSAVAAVAGRWTHLAGVWDETGQNVTLDVDGSVSASVTPSAGWLGTHGAGWTASGSFQVGRERAAGAYGGYFRGQIADVQVFNRVLVGNDFTGQLASDPRSGGVDEPGILVPTEVGRWDFNSATPCYVQDLANTCAVADGGSWGRWLATTRGTALTMGRRGDAALQLDSCYFPDENPPPCQATTEYARSAVKTGLDTTDPANPRTLWGDTSVLRTDQSFTVSAWALIADTSTNRAIVSQRGSHESGFVLKWDHAAGNRWSFFVTDEDNTAAAQIGASSAPVSDPGGAWIHLVGVYDASRSELRLYVGGVRVATTTVPWTPMPTTGALQVGRALWHDTSSDGWNGGIDDVLVYQGAMTDAAVAQLHAAQAVG